MLLWLVLHLLLLMSQNGEFSTYDNGLISITLIDAVNIASLSDNTSLHGL